MAFPQYIVDNNAYNNVFVLGITCYNIENNMSSREIKFFSFRVSVRSIIQVSTITTPYIVVDFRRKTETYCIDRALKTNNASVGEDRATK